MKAVGVSDYSRPACQASKEASGERRCNMKSRAPQKILGLCGIKRDSQSAASEILVLVSPGV